MWYTAAWHLALEHMIALLVHSKSNASMKASRRRLSLNFARRVLKNQPCAPDGVSSGMTSRLTRPSRIAEKSWRVAQVRDVNSSRNR